MTPWTDEQGRGVAERCPGVTHALAVDERVAGDADGGEDRQPDPAAACRIAVPTKVSAISAPAITATPISWSVLSCSPRTTTDTTVTCTTARPRTSG